MANALHTVKNTPIQHLRLLVITDCVLKAPFSFATFNRESIVAIPVFFSSGAMQHNGIACTTSIACFVVADHLIIALANHRYHALVKE